MPTVMFELLSCKKLPLDPPLPKGEVVQKTLPLFEISRYESLGCARDKLSGREYAEVFCAYIWRSWL
jgi:hypothetical protein